MPEQVTTHRRRGQVAAILMAFIAPLLLSAAPVKDGGHNFGCWNMAFENVLPRMMSVLRHP